MKSHLVAAPLVASAAWILLILAGCSSEPPPLALSTPKEAIATMIALLEAEEHERFMRGCIAPDDLQHIMRYNRFRLSLDNMKRQEGKVVLSDLRVVEAMTPEMSEDGTIAFYPSDDLFGYYRALVRVDGRWYLPTRLPEYTKRQADDD